MANIFSLSYSFDAGDRSSGTILRCDRWSQLLEPLLATAVTDCPSHSDNTGNTLTAEVWTTALTDPPFYVAKRFIC